MARLSIGIVGLPNVGKSTLFRALTSISVPAENYPFCTIDPNIGVVEVPDERLDVLHELVRPRRERKVPAVVEFVDIAGLVEGASRGEGLGNQFLGQIRDVDAIAHVVRCFEDPEVARGSESADPVRDYEVIETELALADLEIVAGRIERVRKKARTGERGAQDELELLRRIEARLERGEPARREALDAEERETLRSFNLLTLKPNLVVANVEEEDLASGDPAPSRLREAVSGVDPGAEVLSVSARLEAEVAQFPRDERKELLRAHGLEESGLDRLIRACYRLLGLQTFFTIGEDEVRAWTVHTGASAPEAAGRVHTDFEKGFIRAETIAFETFAEMGSLKRAREEGLVRSEGRDYSVRDGDIMLFRTQPVSSS